MRSDRSLRPPTRAVGPTTRSLRRSGGRAASLALSALLPLLLPTSPVAAQSDPPPACADQSSFHALDFWVGEWVVEVDGREVGRNRIEKVLNGCAVMEHWRSARGGEGKSLFYHVPATGAWKEAPARDAWIPASWASRTSS